MKKIFALGFFDGVHLGHQALLAACVRLAKEQNRTPAAITFARHPQSLFVKDAPPLINSEHDRQQLLRLYGIGPIYTFPVTDEVMSTSWQAFLEMLLEYGATGFVCGNDFRFGRKGEGNGQLLERFCRERGLPCVIVPEQTREGTRISSTYIRQLIQAGEMERAVDFLGHPHLFSAQVVPGQQLGRTIGVPTANLVIPEEVLVPRFGVYACRARIAGESYPAVTNVGIRPTVGGHSVTVEPWILDFTGDLYGKQITLEFYKYLRPEQSFPSLADLRTAISADAAATRQFFQKRS